MDDVRVEYCDRAWPIAGCDCATCGNFFFYVDLPEYQPKMCCYCGQVFLGYVDHAGVRRRTNGLPFEATPE